MASQEKSAALHSGNLHEGKGCRANTLSVKRVLLALLLAGGIFTLSCGRRYSIFNYPIGNEPHSTGNDCQGYKDDPDFEWDKVTPSPTLHWVACYDTEKQCARLEVPLDYSDPHGEKAAIALVKIPAKVQSNDSRYRGPVLFNPGGPGGPGVMMVLKWGPRFQEILGDDYDIIGFDPRGIGYTRPLVDAFPTAVDRAAWDIREFDAPLMNETHNAMAQIIARSRLIGGLVAENVPKAAKHVNTAVVCRDMLSIVNAHGYDKLQYWGFSYGSVLGSSFATLFPNNVGRLVIDGVDDVDDYYKGLWSTNLPEADKGLEMVFEQCAESKGDCALYEPTADKVKERYHQLLSKIDEEPVQISTGGDYTIIRKIMKPFFSALRGLEEGNSTLLWERLKKEFPRVSCHCGAKPDLPTGGSESGRAVMCSDAGAMANDPRALHRHFEKLAKVSSFGDIWSIHRMSCVDWKVEPAWKWKGPVGGNTSFPLLLVGNTADPVTPWANKVSKRFPDSAVLTQNSAGHCSLAAVSLCTAKAIRQYFREGILPAKRTVCEIEDHMFLNRTETVNNVLDEEDAKILEAVRAMGGKIQLGKH